MDVKKVFVVTSGEYSDYHIDGVFLNKDEADEVCIYDRERCVEVWDVTTVKEFLKERPVYVRVDMDWDGNVSSAKFDNYKWSSKVYEDGFSVSVISTDIQKAVKIANEKRLSIAIEKSMLNGKTIKEVEELLDKDVD